MDACSASRVAGQKGVAGLVFVIGYLIVVEPSIFEKEFQPKLVQVVGRMHRAQVGSLVSA